MLKKKLIKFVANHRRLWFILRCLKRMGDESFVYDVTHLYDNKYMHKLECKGDKNRGKILYLIDIRDNRIGFCSIIRYALQECLVGGEELGYLPVIKMSDKSFYSEHKGFKGTDNPWEYYFKQPAGITVEDYNQSYRVTRMTPNDVEYINERYNGIAYNVSKEYLEVLGQVWKKYIFIRDELLEELNNQIYELFNKNYAGTGCQKPKILGIHSRGTDFKDRVLGHPIAVLPEDYFEYIDKIISNYDYIFLATEDSDNLNEFKEKYGDKLIYHKDIVRSDKGKNPVVEQVNKSASRENPNYMLGRDILLDTVTLGQCDGIISGISVVAFCGRMYKISLDGSYIDDITIDKGFCMKDGMSFDEWGKIHNVPESDWGNK